jgi:hypothetical protein
LRIRQPASLRLALIELDMRPSRACLSYAPAGNPESAGHRIVASSGRPTSTRVAAPR